MSADPFRYLRKARLAHHVRPQWLSGDARRLLRAKGLRAFADGLVSVVLPLYLLRLGYTPVAVGAIVTSTLLGSAALTLAVGFFAHQFPGRRILMCACVLMTVTGIAFGTSRDFWLLLAVAFVGTINPSAGDVSVFLPVEQALLAGTVPGPRRTGVFARYSLVGALAGAFGTLAAALPGTLARVSTLRETAMLQAVFWFYAAVGLAAWVICRALTSAREPQTPVPRRPLSHSRHIVFVLASLFSLDAFGGGFFVQSLLALWLFQAFHLSIASASTVLFWAGICSAGSFVVAVPIAERFGLINTMVFTHLPSNVLLIMVPFAPNLPIAVGLLLARSALSQLDVPTRTSFVMAVVRPEERAAAASVTAVPRSLASALSPLLAGYLLSLSNFGWPLLIGGILKAIYDILLLLRFRNVVSPDEPKS